MPMMVRILFQIRLPPWPPAWELPGSTEKSPGSAVEPAGSAEKPLSLAEKPPCSAVEPPGSAVEPAGSAEKSPSQPARIWSRNPATV